MASMMRMPVAKAVSFGQDPVRDRTAGDLSQEFVKGIPTRSVRLGLIGIYSGRMVEVQTLVGENARGQRACTRKAQFTNPLDLEIHAN